MDAIQGSLQGRRLAKLCKSINYKATINNKDMNGDHLKSYIKIEKQEKWKKVQIIRL